VENVHEPLVDMDTYNLVQEKVKMRKRPDAWGNYGIFAGIVKCGECGSSMNQRVANAKFYEDWVAGRINEANFTCMMEKA